MQSLVRHRVHRVREEEHPGQAVPARSQPRYRAHLADSLAAAPLPRSVTVLFAFTSRVTVEGLTPIAEAIFLALQDPWIPWEITSLWSTVSWGLGAPVIFGSSRTGDVERILYTHAGRALGPSLHQCMQRCCILKFNLPAAESLRNIISPNKPTPACRPSLQSANW